MPIVSDCVAEGLDPPAFLSSNSREKPSAFGRVDRVGIESSILLMDDERSPREGEGP